MVCLESCDWCGVAWVGVSFQRGFSDLDAPTDRAAQRGRAVTHRWNSVRTGAVETIPRIKDAKEKLIASHEHIFDDLFLVLVD